jgi:hypothetical protein
MDRSEPTVTRADGHLPVLLQVLKEGEHLAGLQVDEREFRDRAPGALGVFDFDDTGKPRLMEQRLDMREQAVEAEPAQAGASRLKAESCRRRCVHRLRPW